MLVVDEICELLETYNGRDKVVRLACYVLKLWGSVADDAAVLKASSKLSATRATLRLFDDLPMLRHTIRYGFGSQENDISSSILGVVGNLADQLFFPVEKVCWLSDIGMLNISPQNAKKFETINTSLWVLSLYIGFLKSLKQVKHISTQKECLKLASEGEDVQSLIDVKQRIEFITTFKLMLDIVHAVNCLPEGWLWGNKIDGVKVGTIATISSVIGIGLHFARKRYLK